MKVCSKWTALLFALQLSLPAAEAAETATISIARNGTDVAITFSGRLEATDTLGGTWTEVPTATSPYLEDAAQARRFYRAVATGISGLFDDTSVVNWVITGPLQQHFELAMAGTPDGIIPPTRPKPYFDGRVKMGAFDLPATLRVRGNSSLQECPFPKLKLKVSKEARAGTPFADAREVKIGTHCAEGGRGNIGRLREQVATYREALAYETMQLLGFTTPRIRRARIEYHDNTPAKPADPSEAAAPPIEVDPVDPVPTTGWQLTRLAFIVEDVEVLADRLGGRALDDEEIAALTNAGFPEQLIVELRALHALFGNWDYTLSTTGEELWNTDVIELADGSYVPVAGDFDLSSWVTESVLLSAPHDYLPELPEIDREARYRLQTIQTSTKPAIFAAAAERFVANREKIEAHLAAALVDDTGRTNAQRHITAFYEALAAVLGNVKP